jgi:hypothetical protein
MDDNEVSDYTVSDAGGGGIIRLIINGTEYQLTAGQAYSLGTHLVEWGRP